MVDGEQILSNPNNEFGLLLDFFEVDKSLIEFEFNDDRGFYCMSRPINYCLGSEKGTSRKVTMSEKYAEYPDLKIIAQSYKNQMLKTFQYIYKCEESCCDVKLSRFAWLKNFFC